MSDKQTRQTNKPTHYLYHVPEVAEGQKANWTRIGAAWAHQDGKGYNAQVDLMPMTGRIVIREVKQGEAE